MLSSVIRSFKYDESDQALVITFTSGRRYRYHEAPRAIYQAMKAANSKGEFFNKAIRDRFRFTVEH